MAISRKLFGDTASRRTVDEFAMKLVKNNERVGHLPCEYSRILWYYIARGGKIRVAVTGCSHLFVRVKRTINRLKELLKSKIR